MKKDHFYLFSSKPFDFGGFCSACHRQTNESIAVDVSRRKDIGLTLAELSFHPLALLDLKNLKSVRIPHCNTCRFSIWMLRLFSLLAFLGLLILLVSLISSDSNSKLKNSNDYIYLFVTAVFGIVLIPFVYTTLKEFFVGAEVSLQDGMFCYRFRSGKIPEFLESRRLCQRSPDDSRVYIADQTD